MNVVREPVWRKGKDGRFGVVELEEDFEAVGAKPTGDFDAPVERGFLGDELLVCN